MASRIQRIPFLLLGLMALAISGFAAEDPRLKKELEEKIVLLKGKDKIKADEAARWVEKVGYSRSYPLDLRPAVPVLIDAAAKWPDVDSFLVAARGFQCPKGKEAVVVALLRKAVESKRKLRRDSSCSDRVTSLCLLLGSLGGEGRTAISVLGQLLQSETYRRSALLGLIRTGKAGSGTARTLYQIASKKGVKDAADKECSILAAIALANLNVQRAQMLKKLVELRAQPHQLTYLAPCVPSTELTNFVRRGNSEEARVALYAMAAYLDIAQHGGRKVRVKGYRFFRVPRVERDGKKVKQILQLKEHVFRRAQAAHEPNRPVRELASSVLKVIRDTEKQLAPKKPAGGKAGADF